MTDLVPSSPAALTRFSAGPAEFQISKRLGAAIYDITKGSGLADNVRADLLAPEASALLPQIERLCRAPDQARLDLWFGTLNALVVSLPPDAFQARINALADPLREMPAPVFTAKTAAEVARTGEFFPTLKRIMDVLEPKAIELLSLRSGLRTIAGAKPQPQIERSAAADDVDRIVSSLGEKFASSRSAARRPAVSPRGMEIGTTETPIPTSYLNPIERQKAYENAALTASDPKLRPLLADRAARLASHLGETKSHTTETTPGEGL